jgi:hypothetical protein
MYKYNLKNNVIKKRFIDFKNIKNKLHLSYKSNLTSQMKILEKISIYLGK